MRRVRTFLASGVALFALLASPAFAQITSGSGSDLTGTSAGASLSGGTLTGGTSAGSGGTFWGQGVSSTVPQGGCDPAVQKMEDNNNRYMIDNYANMASNLYTPMPPQGYTGLSCLDQLLNSGLTGFFTPQSIESILAALIGAVCSFAEGIVQQAEMPLNQSLYGAAPLGQVIPGVSLGGLIGGAGVSVSPMMGGNPNGGLLNITGPTSLTTGSVGTTSIGSGNLASYWGGGSAGQPSYGTLLGSTPGATTGLTTPVQTQPTTGFGNLFGGTSLFGN